MFAKYDRKRISETLVTIRSIKFFLAAIGFVAVTSAQAVVSSPISGLVIFGDSLSDSGNNTLHPLIGAQAGQTSILTPIPFGNSYVPGQTYAEFGGTASNPYATYSNGAVWATQFANMLGVPLAPSNAGGTNYAFGGAVTGTDQILHPSFPQFPLPSLKSQEASYLSAQSGPLSPDTLYVIAGGGNNARATFQSLATSNNFGTIGAASGAAASQYANDIGFMVDQLQAAGAQRIIVWNTPKIVLVPAINKGVPITASGLTGLQLGSLVAGTMNGALATRLAGETGVQIFDVYQFMTNVVANPGANGLVNVTEACGAPAAGIDCSTALFFDGIHPTTFAHGKVADAMFALAVPEPSEIAMMLIGLLVVVGASRRKAA